MPIKAERLTVINLQNVSNHVVFWIDDSFNHDYQFRSTSEMYALEFYEFR